MEERLFLLAADAVFAAKETGYGDKGPAVTNHLVELVRGAKDEKAE